MDMERMVTMQFRVNVYGKPRDVLSMRNEVERHLRVRLQREDINVIITGETASISATDPKVRRAGRRGLQAALLRMGRQALRGAPPDGSDDRP